jgi:hypothetical protein
MTSLPSSVFARYTHLHILIYVCGSLTMIYFRTLYHFKVADVSYLQTLSFFFPSEEIYNGYPFETEQPRNM